MRLSVHIAALFLMLVQSIGLCACRMDNCHLLCPADHAPGTTCTNSGNDGPANQNCDTHQQQLKEVRSEQGKHVDFSAVPLPVPSLALVSADAAPSIRPSDSTAPPAAVGGTVSLPLLN